MRLLSLAALCPLQNPLIFRLSQIPVRLCTKTANLVRKIHSAISRRRERLDSLEESNSVLFCAFDCIYAKV